MAEDADAAARLRALGYVSGHAPRKARYTEDDDPKRLVELDNAVHRALDALGEGRQDEAAKIYRDVIARRPGMVIAYRHLALIDWQHGNAAGAVDVLRQALAHAVTDARLLEQLGEYLTETGQLAEGIGLLEQAAGDLYAEVDALNALGIAYARAGRPADARRAFERLLEALPGSSAPLENLGVLALDRGDVRAATDYFDRAIVLAPGSSKARAGAGAAAFQRGDRKAAYDAWARAVELDPQNLDALYGLGVNLARDGRMAEARPYLQRFLHAAPPQTHAGAIKEGMGKAHPLGRAIDPADTAAAAMFLASDLASNITGVNLPVDGGLTAGRKVGG
jgi:Tfp pilus assembly protein PilF